MAKSVKITYEYQGLEVVERGNLDSAYDWRDQTGITWYEGSEECDESKVSERVKVLASIESKYGKSNGKQYRNIKVFL